MALRLRGVLTAVLAVATLSIGAVSSAHGSTPGIGPRNGSPSPPSTVTAVIATIPVGIGPEGVAVSNDDTVYVSNYNSNPSTVSVISGITNTLVDTVPVADRALGIAVGADDTVYVANDYQSRLTILNGRDLDDSFTIALPYKPLEVVVGGDDSVYITNIDDSAVTIVNGRRGTIDDTVQVPQGPYGVAVNTEDTVYVASSWPVPFLSSINGRSGNLATTTSVGNGPIGVAVSLDDTVYVANRFASTLTILRGRSLDESTTLPMADPFAVATTDQDVVYVTRYSTPPGNVHVVNGRTGMPMDTVSVGSNPLALDVSSRLRTAYIANKISNTVSVLTQVSPIVSTPTAVADSRVSVHVTFPADDSILMDDTTVQSISFGGTPVTGWERDAGRNSWSGPMPMAATGTTLEVTITFQGGNTASAGSVTVVDPSPPGPSPLPPSAPTDVRATAGDASATVAWIAPASPGSFPVSTYQVTSTPTGGSCLTSQGSCRVTGLRNGTTYTFSVRALNGAGWGPYSAPSPAVTPSPGVRPSLVITGSRGEVGGVTGVQIVGMSTGFPPGARLRAWIRLAGEDTYTQGRARIRVSDTGAFVWERRTRKKAFVYITSEDGSTRSNTVVVPRT